jgi:hypothetical protein
MRPILAKITTYTEIEERLSLCDLLDIHEAMDIKEEIEEWNHEQSRPKK